MEIFEFPIVARFLAIFVHFDTFGTAAQYRRRPCSTVDGASKMGTVVPRKRSDGSTGYQAQVLIKRTGKIVHRENRTFDRQQAASAWLEKREKELAKPGALERLETPDPTLTTVIDRYTDESITKIGRTKAQVLRAIKNYDIANKDRGSQLRITLRLAAGSGSRVARCCCWTFDFLRLIFGMVIEPLRSRV